MAQNQQNQNQNQVRIDVTASGQDPQAINALTALIARTLQQHLPDQKIHVAGQDKDLQGSLESMNLDENPQLNVSDIIICADSSMQFRDPSGQKDLRSFNVPMAQRGAGKPGQSDQLGSNTERGH